MFLNRNNELRLLQSDFEKPRATINFIFGRRKVGKTTLLNKYTENKKTLQLSSFEMTKDLFFKNQKKRIDEYFNLDNKILITTINELFKYISDQKIEEKIVLTIENINYLVNINKDFLSNVFYSWNKFLKFKNIQLIITSSIYSSFKTDLEIYSNADNIIKLDNINMVHLKNFFPKNCEDDFPKIYSVFGSNIYYLNMYDCNKSFYENIENMCLRYDSLLFKEGINIIKNNLNDTVTYLSILHAVAMGNSKIGDIASFINLKSTYITRYMQKLVDIMVLEKKFPIDDDPLKSKFGRYEFTDNFMKFWFCFVYPNFDLINQNKSSEVLNLVKKDFKKMIFHDTYKKMVMEKIEQDYEEEIGYKPLKIGSWWNNSDKQIDIVAYNSKYITFIDCMTLDEKNDKILENRLIEKSNSFNTTLLKKYLIYS